ncbi:MAG: MFS transporter [Verrucomicrobiaceae bacterium]|nr:MFS transporter [Verrucomicrobiaceae bacterium]
MKPTRARFIVLAGVCSAAALAYFVRNGVAPAESTIRADLGLTKEQSGLMMSAFFWPYALCQIPAAMLAQRIGTRWALALYAVLWSLATAGFALGELGWMTASRACMGVAQAGLVPVGVSAMARWFPKSSQATASGAFSGFMSAGSIVAAPLTAWLVTDLGWRGMFVFYAIPGVLWAAWFAWWHRDEPARHPAVNAAELDLIGHPAIKAVGGATTSTARSLAANPALWLLCMQQFLRAAGYIFFASWFATYLQEARGMALVKSAWLTTLPLLADVAGGFSGGLISDALLRRTQSCRIARQGMAMTALLLCAALIFTAWFVADPVLAVVVISAGMYCAGVVNPCFSATLMTCGGPQTATWSAVTNMCGNFGAASFPILVPWLIARAGGWDAVLFAFGAIYILAAVIWLLLPTERE